MHQEIKLRVAMKWNVELRFLIDSFYCLMVKYNHIIVVLMIMFEESFSDENKKKYIMATYTNEKICSLFFFDQIYG